MERLRPRTVERTPAPAREPGQQATLQPRWLVTVFDNDTNTYEEVMTVLMLATACSAEEAYIEAWEIDHFGQCVVHRSDESECRGVADVVGTIGIRVEAGPEA
jgi:ATP-dependent Clp protease adaptor protein ClpS